VSPDLEGHNGAMFDAKACAVLTSSLLMDVTYRARFFAESDALVSDQAGAAFQ
jgi:hypothetical protein